MQGAEGWHGVRRSNEQLLRRVCPGLPRRDADADAHTDSDSRADRDPAADSDGGANADANATVRLREPGVRARRPELAAVRAALLHAVCRA